MEGTGEAAPFFLFCIDLFLKHELRNTTDISFFMIAFVLYNVSFFMFPSCFSVLNVLIQAYTVLFRCKNILNRFIIRVTLYCITAFPYRDSLKKIAEAPLEPITQFFYYHF